MVTFLEPFQMPPASRRVVFLHGGKLRSSRHQTSEALLKSWAPFWRAKCSVMDVLGMSMSKQIAMWPTSLMASCSQTGPLPAPTNTLHKSPFPGSFTWNAVLFQPFLSYPSYMLRCRWKAMKPSFISLSLEGTSAFLNYHSDLCHLPYLLLFSC